MKRYPEYKDSGVGWIGDMPKNWKVTKIKHTIKHTLSNLIGGVWGTEPQGNENDIYCIRVADFDYVQLTLSTYNLTLRNISPKERSKRILRNNDLLIEKSGGGEKTPVGRTIMFDGGIPRLSVSSNFISKVSVKSDSCFPKYLLYCLNSMYQLGLTRKHIKQSTGLQNLDIDSYFQEKIPFSSLVQQTQIANFLDRKTQQIDDLISVKERKIKLLQEYRASLIQQAVTKGLDPDVEMKQSGVEWIGEIPAHWQTKPVWMMFRLGRGRVISNEKIGDNPGHYPVYSSQTENDGIMGYIDTYEFNGDYITWTTDGAKAGTVFYRTGKFNCTNVCGTLSPSSQDVNLRFFAHALNIVTSRFVRHDINPKLMNNVMAQIRVQVPPLTEQDKIANFLDRKTKQIDELRSTEEQSIKLLKEYRQSLISAVVTGKIDVRGEV